jgi:hypothetical protein
MSSFRSCPDCEREFTVEHWKKRRWGKRCNACEKRLGRSKGLAWVQRDREASRAWKDANRERNRARDRAYKAKRRAA